MAVADLVWDGSTDGDVNVAANWDSRTTGESDRVPTAGDAVIFEGTPTNSPDTNLAQLAAVALGSVKHYQSYTGTLGVAATRSYFECLCADIQIGIPSGIGKPSGSGLTMINAKTTASTIVVHNTGSTANSGTPAVRLLAVNAATTIEVKKGTVGLAIEAGEVSTVATITQGYITNKAGDSDLVIGSGVTLTTLDKTGGDCLLNCAATTVSNAAGILTTEGTGAITTINSTGGTVYPNSTGTVTTCDIDGGHVDTTRSTSARTITTVNLDGPGRFSYDPADVTLTNNVNSSKKVSLTAAAA